MLTLCDILHTLHLHAAGRYVWTLRNFWRAVDAQRAAGVRYWHAELIDGA